MPANPPTPPKDDPKPAAAAPKKPEAPSFMERAGEALSHTAHAAAEVVHAEPKAEPKAALCPNCGGELVPHDGDNPFKAGARHCDKCGGCWVHRGSTWVTRDGHPAPAARP